MKLTVICDHRLTKKDNKFYINTGPYERSIKRYLSVFDSIDYVCRTVEDNDIQGKVIISDKNVRIITNNYPIDVRLIFNYPIIVKNIKKVIDNSEICIIHLPSIMGIIAVRELNNLDKHYLIEVVGSVWDSYWNHSIKGKFLAPVLTLFTKISINNAMYVLYVTERYLQNKLPTRGIALACSDVSLPYISENILIKRLEKIGKINKDKPIVIGTTAVMNVRYKGQEYIIKTISKLNQVGYNFEYHLVGGGDNSYLKSIAKKYNIINSVKFLGYLPHEKIFEYLDNVDIYAQPSKTEGLPRALVEAMSRGCLCIGSNVGGIPELINNNFIFRYGKIEKIIDILKQITKDTMIKEAERNFNKSKEFDKALLDKKRNDFFKIIAKEVKNID